MHNISHLIYTSDLCQFIYGLGLVLGVCFIISSFISSLILDVSFRFDIVHRDSGKNFIMAMTCAGAFFISIFGLNSLPIERNMYWDIGALVGLCSGILVIVIVYLAVSMFIHSKTTTHSRI